MAIHRITSNIVVNIEGNDLRQSPQAGSGGSPRRTERLQEAGGLEPRRPAADGRGPTAILAKEGFGDLPPDLLRKVHAHVKAGSARDEAALASVNKGTFEALNEHRQQRLSALARQARTPEALMDIVRKYLTLAEPLRAELLQAAGHQLGRVTHDAADSVAAAPVFRALFAAVIDLPVQHRPAPLFAIARHVAALPPEERLAAMNAALDHISQVPVDRRRYGNYETTRFQIVRDFAYLLPRLPAQHRETAYQRLSAEGGAFSGLRQQEFAGLLKTAMRLTPASK